MIVLNQKAYFKKDRQIRGEFPAGQGEDFSCRFRIWGWKLQIYGAKRENKKNRLGKQVVFSYLFFFNTFLGLSQHLFLQSQLKLQAHRFMSMGGGLG